MSYEMPVPTNTFSVMNPIKNLNITKLVMFETGEYNPQYRRPYTANMTAENLSLIEERITGAGKITATTLSGIGLKFVAPTAAPESELRITNGWGTRRIRFMMEVTYEHQLGQKHIEVLTGYTDEVGVSHGMHVNPAMVFYINSVIHLRVNQHNTPMGPQESVMVTQNSHLLGDPDYRGVGFTRDVYLRPQDVFAEMSNLDYDKSGGLVDSRTAASGKAAMSTRGHANPNQYLGRLMENYLNAHNTTESGAPMNSYDKPGSVYDTARLYAIDHHPSTDTVLKQIQNVAQTNGVTTYFRYADLCALDPSIDQRKFLSIAGSTAAREELHQVGRTEYWHAPSNMTLAASILSQVIPALMSDSAMTRLAFISHNHSIGSQPIVLPVHVMGFTTMDMTASTETFKARFITEIMMDLTYNNQLQYHLEVDADLLGEISIILSLGNEPQVQYITPTFADALMAPITTGNQNQAAHLAKQVDLLVGQLTGVSQTPTATSSPTNSHIFDSV